LRIWRERDERVLKGKKKGTSGKNRILRGQNFEEFFSFLFQNAKLF
jgi:hypothetical protein